MKRLIIKIFATVAFGGLIMLAGLQSCKHEPFATIDIPDTSSNPPIKNGSQDGAVLYANNCAGCHGILASSAKLGATTSRIQGAISSVSNMKSLSFLTASQIKAISDALGATPMPTDGASLYAINCASCHGILANSEVGGSSVSKIQNAIKEKSQMKYLSTLTLAQLQAISGALANVKGGDDD